MKLRSDWLPEVAVTPLGGVSVLAFRDGQPWAPAARSASTTIVVTNGSTTTAIDGNLHPRPSP